MIQCVAKKVAVSERTIAVLGENLVDLLVDPAHNVTAVVGGGPLNVARTIGQLGGDVHFISGLSNDAFGSFVLEALRESGVRLAFEESLNLPTTLAVVEMNPRGPRYHFHLNDTASFALDPDATYLVIEEISPLAAIYFGTLGLVIEPMASIGETTIMRAPYETLVIIDPNCRPSAIRDHGRFRARVSRLCTRADVVKVSREDLDFLHPELTTLAGARRLVDDGAHCVVLTDGAEPVTVLTADFHFTADVARTSVVDTVGAGDALVGGFVTWWTAHALTPSDLDDQAMLAAAIDAAIDISRVTCQRAGASPPRRGDVVDLARWRWL
jgi:fructokinase